jgi:hypothetical protein
MDNSTKRSLRVFWLWQEDKEMKWLRQMSLNGWHLINSCIFVYTFVMGEPKDLVYYGDFKPIRNKDVDEYKEFFEDAGWRTICRQGNWFNFSSSADNKHGEVYSDNQSRLGKYRILLLMHVIIFPVLFYSFRFFFNRFANNETLFMGALLLTFLVFFLAAVYSTIKLIALVTKLQKSSRE